MSNTPVDLDLDDEDEDDDAYEFAADFVDSVDHWEDNPAFLQIKASVPEGWHLIKINNYNWQMLLKLEEYLNENCSEGWRKVRWSVGYCSYSTGVMVKGAMAAMKLRLRYG